MKENIILSVLIGLSTIIMSCVGNTSNSANALKDVGVKANNDLAKNNLKGSVKRITTTVYSATDKFGKTTKGDLNYKSIETYNEKGNIKEDSNISRNSQQISTYNEKGNIIELNFYQNGTLIIKRVYNYDEKDYLIELYNYEQDGSLSYKNTYKNDDKGNPVATIASVKQPNGPYSINQSNEFYDKTGNLIEDDSPYYKHIFKYDEKGNKIEQDEINKEDSSQSAKHIYKYDDKGNIVSAHHIVGTQKEVDIEYKYDNFDKAGNWTTETGNGSIYEREIEYY
jgi:hypothetical protein